MRLGLSISFFMVFYSIIFDPFSFAEWEAINDKLVIFESCLLILLFALIVSIEGIARYHFFLLEIYLLWRLLRHLHRFYASSAFSRTLLSKRIWLRLSIFLNPDDSLCVIVSTSALC